MRQGVVALKHRASKPGDGHGFPEQEVRREAAADYAVYIHRICRIVPFVHRQPDSGSRGACRLITTSATVTVGSPS